MMCTNSSIHSGEATVKGKKLKSTHNPPPQEASYEWIKLGHSPTPQVKGGSP